MNLTRGGWVILLTLFAGVVFTMVHLPGGAPDWLGWLRPAWVLVIVFYWAFAVPHRTGLISAWLVGLLLDIALADPLGLNAMLLAGVTYVAWRFCDRLKMYAISQQCVIVFLLILAADVVRLLVQDLAWDRGFSPLVLVPALVSTLLWPVVYLVLEQLRLRFRVD